MCTSTKTKSQVYQICTPLRFSSAPLVSSNFFLTLFSFIFFENDGISLSSFYSSSSFPTFLHLHLHLQGYMPDSGRDTIYSFPSFLSSFLPSFLPSFLLFFLPSFFSSFLPSILPSFLSNLSDFLIEN